MVSKTARVLSNLQKKKRLDILKPEETLQWMMPKAARALTEKTCKLQLYSNIVVTMDYIVFESENNWLLL